MNIGDILDAASVNRRHDIVQFHARLLCRPVRRNIRDQDARSRANRSADASVGVMACTPTPISCRCMWPYLRNCSQESSIRVLGMAKPIPSLPPDWLRMNVSMPTMFAGRVHQRSAAVARIDGRIGLDIHEGAVGIGLPRDGTDHAHAHRVAQPLAAAERETQPPLGGACGSRRNAGRQALRRNLDQRQIEFLEYPDQRCIDSGANA